MYAVAVAAFILLFAGLYSQLAVQLHGVAAAYRQQTRVASLSRLAEGIERHVNEVGGLPTSLDALTQAPGFEYLRANRDSWQAYSLSGLLSDGTWTFQRAVIVSKDPRDGVDSTAYLAMNRCGTDGPATAPAWCGHPSGAWWRRETREELAVKLAEQRGRHHRMLHKWAAHYSANDAFPSIDQNGDPLVAGSITQLRTLAGYAGNADACSGNFVYAGIPVDCAEMFDQWGSPIGYQYLGPGHIVIVAEPPFTKADGTRPLIATDLEVIP